MKQKKNPSLAAGVPDFHALFLTLPFDLHSPAFTAFYCVVFQA